MDDPAAPHPRTTRAAARSSRFARPRRSTPASPPTSASSSDPAASSVRAASGTVYEVLDRRLGRVAALKVMRAAVPPNDPDARRFVREAEVTARLDHPAIPPVHEAGTDATGRRSLLMRRIEGEALSRRVQATHAGGARPDRAELRALVEVLVKVCDAVAYAHSQGVVHRDLKPANVMVGRFGEVLVLDWGIVRLLGRAEDTRGTEDPSPAQPGGDPQLTMAGGALGTPGYMPPEQIEDAASVNARADVFALGAILCDLLTGRPPVVGETVMNVISATLQHRISRPRDRWPGVPPALDAIAAAALTPSRDARTQSAAALAADLRAWLASEPVAAYRRGRALGWGRCSTAGGRRSSWPSWPRRSSPQWGARRPGSWPAPGAASRRRRPRRPARPRRSRPSARPGTGSTGRWPPSARRRRRRAGGRAARTRPPRSCRKPWPRCRSRGPCCSRPPGPSTG